ncbi:hypothetical protein ACJX0J_027558, partial [Zea mays]
MASKEVYLLMGSFALVSIKGMKKYMQKIYQKEHLKENKLDKTLELNIDIQLKYNHINIKQNYINGRSHTIDGGGAKANAFRLYDCNHFFIFWTIILTAMEHLYIIEQPHIWNKGLAVFPRPNTS